MTSREFPLATDEPPVISGALPLSALQVAALRVRCGLSLDQWAQMLGVNPRTVRSWESGRDGMSARSTALVWRAVDEHNRLIDSLFRAESDDERTDLMDGPMPRQWYLSAYGRVLGAA